MVALALLTASCRAGVSPSPGSATAIATPSLPPTPSPTAAPWLLLGDQADLQLEEALAEVAARHGLEIRTETIGETGPQGAGLEAVVATQAELAGWLGTGEAPGFPVVVIGASDLSPSDRVSRVGGGWRYEQEGFLGGAAAGLASVFQGVGLAAGDGSAAAADFAEGFSEGVRYTCPRCRLESVSDPSQVPFGVDVIGLPPGVSLPPSGPAASSVWVVASAAADPGGWRDRLALEFVVNPANTAAAALGSLLSGGSGELWVPAVENGGLRIGAVNPHAISPGRERLLRQAEALLAGGEIRLPGGS